MDLVNIGNTTLFGKLRVTSNHYHTEVEQIVQQNQLPNEIKPAFKELKVLQHLKTVG
jgi:hypothetical protein